MCGLVGAVARRDVLPVLMEGLKRLEYRGYDSSGVALLDGGHTLSVRRGAARVGALALRLRGVALSSPVGIAHTRWTSLGGPDERNALPQLSHDAIAVVHNGSIENCATLRATLAQAGYRFESETDTEVVAHLVHQQLKQARSLFEAVQLAVQRLRGAYAVAVICESEPEVLVVARQGSPLAIGVGSGEQFVASDVEALLPVTRHFIFPEEGDVVLLKHDDITIVDATGAVAIRPLRQVEPDARVWPGPLQAASAS